MDKVIEMFKHIRTLFLAAAETGLALVGFAVVVFLLLGPDSGSYILSIVENIGKLVQIISPPAIIAVALIAALIALISKRG